MAGLSFAFPGFEANIGSRSQTQAADAPTAAAAAAASAAAAVAHGASLDDDNFGGAADLDALSGEDDDEEPLEQQQVAKAAPTAPPAAPLLPALVLPLLAAQLAQRDAAALACTCSAFHDQLLEEDLWPDVEAAAAAATISPPPASLVSTGSRRSRLRAAATLSRVSQQWGVLRKGWEFTLAGFEELWAALGGQPATPPPAAAAPPAATTPSKAYRLPDGGTTAYQLLPLMTAAQVASPPPTAAAASSSAAAGAPHPEPQQRGGRQLQRVLDKLAASDWQLAYASFSAALAARCDDIADQLGAWWRETAAEFPPAPASALPAAALADCATGVLQHAHRAAGEDVGGMAELLLAAEPELLLAATRRGPRPAAAILLARRVVLHVWPLYSRWLELVTARCSLLGERVHAARQFLLEPAAAALLPSMRNKGLLAFRGRVWLSYGLRRPLQHAALWLAAAAAGGDGEREPEGSGSTQLGGGGGDDAALLTALRKLLIELDIADGEEEAGQHAKFRRCFSALLAHERRRHELPACAW